MPLKSGSRPPTLVEVLRSAALIGGGAQMVIEVKPGNADAADALIQLFSAHPSLLACVGVIMSFDAFIMNDFAPKLAKLWNRGEGNGGQDTAPLAPAARPSFRATVQRALRMGALPSLLLLTVAETPGKPFELQSPDQSPNPRPLQEQSLTHGV